MTDREQLLALAHHVHEAVTCPQCNEPFKKPRILPNCFHTFCEDCLRSEQRLQDLSTDALPSLRCPKCTCESLIAEDGGGVDALQKNYFADKLLEIANHMRNSTQGCINNENVVEFVRQLNDILECPVCRELYLEPRMLPCLHTFCIRCLRGCCMDSWSLRLPKCPLCRHVFPIPTDLESSLPTNEILEKVLNIANEPEMQNLISRYLDPETVPDDLREVGGVAEMCGRLYVLSSRSKHINIFMSQAPYAMIGQIQLDAGLEPTDLAASSVDNCVYVTDASDAGCVWRIKLEEQFQQAEMMEVVFGGESNDELMQVASTENCNSQINSGDVGSSRAEDIASSVSVEQSSSVNDDTSTPLAEMSAAAAAPREYFMDELPGCRTDDGALSSSQSNAEDSEEFRKLIESLFNSVGSQSAVQSLPLAAAADLEEMSVEQAPPERNKSDDGMEQLIRGLLERSGLLKAIAQRREGPDGSRFVPCVWQLTTSHKVERWLSGVNAVGVSVGADGQVVLVSDAGRLLVYRSDGQLAADHELPAETQKPRHAVCREDSGSFIVSHSSIDGSCHGITELLLDPVSASLRIVRSYTSTRSQSVRRLRWPRHIVLDNRGWLFVADCGNDRVLLLDPELEINRVMLSRYEGLERPWRLCLDEKHGNLIVGSVTGSIQVFRITASKSKNK